ncbi:Fe-S cluster assembly protein SufD [Reinekea marinisedimentorum]|uniref:Fe-S cluster assembly protein SufD n=1 Tax=Reinekea marinisedimentorum TaxID=230495 RepID=A0A4R3I7K5_9GAMM|nr:Fe-S cluster assembly protein SufD [Reinekea marinisedimentorum]TCS42017.1 Fe-S cluster assembly protein SufD [Reinekea marinisedimentorum]
MSNSFDTSDVFSAANAASQPAWLKSWQAAGQSAFTAATLPTRKTEAWKYTPLKEVVAVPWQKHAETDFGEGIQFADWNEVSIRIENGKLNFHGELPAGVTLISSDDFSEAQAQSFIEKIEAQRGSFFFDSLNQGALDQGYWLKIDKNVQAAQPLHFNFLQAGSNSMVNTQLLIEVEPGANATVAETFTQVAGCVGFTNANTTIVVGENAHLTHYHLLLEQGESHHIGRVSAALERSARLTTFHMAIGGVLKRKDIAVVYRGEGAELSMNGVYLPTGNEVIDYHTSIDHAVPNCVSNQIFRGILGEQGKAVFNGRIHIHPHAQKSLADMNNRNLLLSPKAEIDTKPELEIYADDVRCAHGATIAQLDDNMLFYFLSRGISRAEAEVMLSFGFINELLDALSDEPVRLLLQPMLSELFAKGQADLTRHIP